MDMLAQQLDLQRGVYGNDPHSLAGEELAEWVRWNCLALMREVGEALNEVEGWKPWSHVEKPRFANRDKFVEELAADAFRFLANLLLAAGVDDRELIEVYMRKRDELARREESGTYSG